MIKKFFFLFLLLSSQSFAKSSYDFSGKAYHRFFGYTNAPDKYAGQDHWLLAQQKGEFFSNLSFKAQVYAYAGNSKADQIQATDNIEYRSQVSEVWAGDLYLQASAGPALLKLGFQQLNWQEGQGLSYTNFINGRDYRAVVFDPIDQAYRSAPAANLIISGDHLSIQGAFLPYSQHDIYPPFSRSGGTLNAAQLGQTVELRAPPQYQASTEYGGRVTWAGTGIDVSFFYFYLKDRKLVYSVSPFSTPSNLRLEGNQSYLGIMGGTSTINIQDFLLRLEYLEMPKRQWNKIVSQTLTTEEIKDSAFTIAIDSPVWEHFSFSAQGSLSNLDYETTGLERKKLESYSFGSLNYTFKADQVLKVLALYHASDKSIWDRVSFSWPISKMAELEVAYETAAGSTPSAGDANKDLSRGYLQLNHVF